MSYIEQKFNLDGKTAIITGGGGTLCGAIAQGFACAGANVVLWDIRPEAMEAKAEEIGKKCGDPSKIACVEVNLLDEESIQKGLVESAKKFGSVDILLNGAGGNRGKGPLIDVKADDFEFVLKLNLLAGCVLPTKYIAKYWIDNKIKGNIINVASMAGFNPLSGVWAYSAAKAGVMNQTMGYAKEFAQYGIRVNAIAPGFFIADQNRKLLLNDDGTPTQRGKDVLERTPMDKFGTPDELAGATIFLASEASGFISGITMPIDGGYLCNNI
ncbi:MAG: SDR family oxidoreductase [Anaerohalosphaeraceae bacterium]|nr:SDR family oxidoreductase [Anaerohalosphaeraceae bacterium]